MFLPERDAAAWLLGRKETIRAFGEGTTGTEGSAWKERGWRLKLATSFGFAWERAFDTLIESSRLR